MEDFEIEFRQGYLEMAGQALSQAESCFLNLEKQQGEATNQTIEEIFRIVHNLKSSAMASGYSTMGEFCHKVESLLLKIKNKQVELNRRVINLLLQCNDVFVDMIAVYTKDLVAPYDCSQIEEKVIAALEGYLPEEESPSTPVNAGKEVAEETIAFESVPEASQFSEAMHPSAAPANIIQIAAAPKPTATFQTDAQAKQSPQASAAVLSKVSSNVSSNTSAHLIQRYLNFSMGSGQYAIPLLSVREVIAVPKLKKVPQGPSHFLGIHNLRGEIICVLDLAAKLGLKKKSADQQECAVVICDLGGLHVGVVVDSVNSVINPKPEYISPSPAIQTNAVGRFGSAGLDPQFISAIYRRSAENSEKSGKTKTLSDMSEELILILDLARCLNPEDRKALHAKAA